MISLVIASAGRAQTLINCLRKNIVPGISEVIVVSDGCEETCDAVQGVQISIPLILVALPSKVGAGTAKHQGIMRASRDFVLLIDDDAEIMAFDYREALGKFTDAKLALIQGKIYDETGVKIRDYEQPFFFKKDRNYECRIGYFVGAMHLIKRSAYSQVLGYTSSPQYGFEELILSIRLLRNGYYLRFCPQYTIRHLKVPSGRLSEDQTRLMMLKGRVAVANVFFPRILAFVQIIIWNVKYFRYTKQFIWRERLELTDKKLRVREFLKNRLLFARSLF